MDKISSILPGNNRVQNVDMDGSHPIRPGTATFGRPEGSTSSGREKIRQKAVETAAADRASFSEKAMQAAGETETSQAPSKVSNHFDEKEEMEGKIADQVTRGFSDTVRKPTSDAAKETFMGEGEETSLAQIPMPKSIRSVDKYA
jgi:hypothetical protein